MSYMIRSLTKADLEQIYPYMEQDFPANELKPKKMIRDSLDSGFMEGYGYYKKDQLLAYSMFVKLDQVLLFDYLAVLPGFRSKGIGSAFLSGLKKQLFSYECVMLEVENPDFCQDGAECEIMNRRIHFYEKNGILDTGASGCVYGVEYRFLELLGKRIYSPVEGMERMNRFYRTYWPKDEDYHRFVQMHWN